MLIRIPRGWEIPEREATSESAFFGRRRFLRALGAAGGALVARPGLAAELTRRANHDYDVEMGRLTSEMVATHTTTSTSSPRRRTSTSTSRSSRRARGRSR